MEYGSEDNIRSASSGILFLLAITPPRISIVLYWVATAMLLRNYSSEIGKGKFWTIMSLPIIALSIGSILIYGGVSDSELVRGILTGVSFDSVGVLFAVTFLMVARAAKKAGHNAMVHNLTLAAFGSVLFVVCGTQTTHIADWIHIPYPPFVFLLSFSYLAAFLYSVGFYFSAIAISKDSSLRKSIKQMAMNHSKFFANIGTAEMEQGIRTRVNTIAKEKQNILEEQTGEAQNDMSEDEMKSYLNQVIKEIKKENPS
jgi:chromate transport protein ChrA